jgi:hypothetical protein
MTLSRWVLTVKSQVISACEIERPFGRCFLEHGDRIHSECGRHSGFAALSFALRK